MTQETKEILYKKKICDLSNADAKYLNQVIEKNEKDILIKIILLLSPITISVILLAFYSIITPIFAGISLIGGIFMSGLLAGIMNSYNYSLEQLGLTKSEWKALKKSGTLSRLKDMMKLYQKTNNAFLHDLEEKEIAINDEINTLEEQKYKLLSQLNDIKQKENHLKGIKIKYSKEQVSEMIRNEENLLLKALDKLKEQQELIDLNQEGNTLNQVGESVKNREFLTID